MPQAPQLDAQSLEEAFHTFNQLSLQLSDSYRMLEQRVAGLNQELAAAHDQRFRELSEKERLANRLALLLDVLPGAVVVLDGQGRVQEHNPAARELLGEPLLNQAWSEIISRVFAPRPDDGHDVSLCDGRRVNISTCPLGAEPGQILLLMDVTEIRHMQQRLNQQQRLAAMGETAASLAHQIRTPIASALLYASQLKRQHLNDAERLRVAERIVSRLRHLEQVVNNMLMYARGGQTGVEHFSAADLFEDLRSSLETQFRLSQTRFTVRDDTGGMTLGGNRQMLLSGLINLAMNAMQAMGEGGELMVAAQCRTSEEIEISVTDNGPGIAPEKHQEIFSPFYTTRKEGTGLGLAVVDAIARNHQGCVSLHSMPGQGSTFTLHLPLQAAGLQQHRDQHLEQLNDQTA